MPGTENYLANGIWHHNSAKSMLALFISLCAELSLPLPWGPTIEPTKVMYLDWETNPETVAKRLRRLCEGAGVEMPCIDYRQCTRPLIDELPALREVVSREHYGLVIVDSIGFAITGKLVDDDTARQAMNALRSLNPATRLVVAHVSKEEANSTAARGGTPFGSRFFWNGMRSGIEVRRSEDQPDEDVIEMGLYHRKANDGRHMKALALRVNFDGINGPITIERSDITESPDLAARTPLSVRVRGALARRAQSTKELSEVLDVPENALRVTLGRMKGVQLVESGGGRGRPSVWGLQA